MGLHFILGSSGSGKTYQLYQKTVEQAQAKQEQNFLVIVPEQFTLQTQKDLVQIHPNGGILNIDVLSFLRLAWRVFGELGGVQRVVLEDSGKSMIVKKVLLKKKHELEMFASNVGRQGFVDEMKSMISELFQYSIDLNKLDQIVDQTKTKPQLNRKLKDIRTIYEGFQEFLQEKYITAEEILDVLSQVAEKSSLIRGSVICLDGFTGFTPAQYKLLHKLLQNTKDIYVTVTIDPAVCGRSLKEHELFYLSSQTIERLVLAAQQEHQDTSFQIINDTVVYRYQNHPELAFLEKHLFRYPAAVYQDKPKGIQIFEAKNREEEVSRTILEIQLLIRKEQYRYLDIAVITEDIAGYGELLQQEMEQAKIPCFLDYKRDILSNPLSELLRSVLDIVDHNYAYEPIFRMLKTGLFDWSHEDIDLFEWYVTALGILGRNRYQKEWKRKYRSAYELDLKKINGLREKFLQMIEPLNEVLSKKSTVKECLTAIFEFLRTYKIEEKLLEIADELKESEDFTDRQKAREYEQVYRLVLELFDRMAELLGDDVLPLTEFRAILEAGLAEAKVGLIPPGTDQVVVGDMERTRLKDIKALFFLGVNEGLVPKAVSGGGILSDADRQLLSEQQVELAPTKRQVSYTTEFYFYLNLTKPNERLYLSFFRLDADGKMAKPSYLIGRMLGLFPKLCIIPIEPYQLSEKEKQEGTQDKELIALLKTDRGRSYLADGLRTYDKEKKTKEFEALFHLYQQNKLGREQELDKLCEAAFYQRKESGISKKAARNLYGATLFGSVTRMENYASCAFSHFLTYGLGLEQRPEYKVALPDIGTLYHMALEKFSGKLKEYDRTWRNVTEEEIEQFGKECVQEACKDYGNGILTSSSRNAYLIKRLERVLHRTLTVVHGQVSSGYFEPDAYEYAFFYADKYLNLRGRIDRLDLYEKDKTIYVRVVDYKSGTTTFDLNSLYYGLELQLGVYLSAGMRKLSEEHPEKKVTPAGVFYYHIADPMVERSDHAQEDIKKKLAMDGLASKEVPIITSMDTEFLGEDGRLRPLVKSQVLPIETTKTGELSKRSNVVSERRFYELLKFIEDSMLQFGQEIMDGVTALNPYRSKEKNACEYCPYASACGFDLKLEGCEYRRLEEFSREEIWKKIEERNRKKGEDHDTMDNGTKESN